MFNSERMKLVLLTPLLTLVSIIFISLGKSSLSFEHKSSKKYVFIRNGTKAIRILSVARIDYNKITVNCFRLRKTNMSYFNNLFPYRDFCILIKYFPK